MTVKVKMNAEKLTKTIKRCSESMKKLNDEKHRTQMIDCRVPKMKPTRIVKVQDDIPKIDLSKYEKFRTNKYDQSSEFPWLMKMK